MIARICNMQLTDEFTQETLNEALTYLQTSGETLRIFTEPTIYTSAQGEDWDGWDKNESFTNFTITYNNGLYDVKCEGFMTLNLMLTFESASALLSQMITSSEPRYRYKSCIYFSSWRFV